MRLLEREMPLDPEVERELEAIDRALAGGRSTPTSRSSPARRSSSRRGARSPSRGLRRQARRAGRGRVPPGRPGRDGARRAQARLGRAFASGAGRGRLVAVSCSCARAAIVLGGRGGRDQVSDELGGSSGRARRKRDRRATADAQGRGARAAPPPGGSGAPRSTQEQPGTAPTVSARDFAEASARIAAASVRAHGAGAPGHRPTARSRRTSTSSSQPRRTTSATPPTGCSTSCDGTRGFVVGRTSRAAGPGRPRVPERLRARPVTRAALRAPDPRRRAPGRDGRPLGPRPRGLAHRGHRWTSRSASSPLGSGSTR